MKIFSSHSVHFIWGTSGLFACLCLFAPLPSIAKTSITPLEKAVEHTHSSHCFFTPPQGWEIIDPQTLSPHVKIAFLKSSGTHFRPSINLAVEKTSVSLSEYLKAVKAIHEQDRGNQWRALGKVKTNAGLAQLTEIDSKTESGPIRILQLILIKDEHAYVLTASALREDFSNHYREIQSSFRSLTLSTDLLSNIPQTDKREMLKLKQHQLIQAAEEAFANPSSQKDLFNDPVFREKHWLPFQNAVLDSFSDMGAYWQVLLLKSTQEKMQLLVPPPVKTVESDSPVIDSALSEGPQSESSLLKSQTVGANQ